MIISAKMQVRIAMTNDEVTNCLYLFDENVYTYIPYLSGEWLILAISRSLSGDKIHPWIVDLDLFAKSVG